MGLKLPYKYKQLDILGEKCVAHDSVDRVLKSLTIAFALFKLKLLAFPDVQTLNIKPFLHCRTGESTKMKIAFLDF